MQRKSVVLLSFLMAKHSFIITVAKLYYAVASVFIRTSANKRVGAVICILLLPVSFVFATYYEMYHIL